MGSRRGASAPGVPEGLRHDDLAIAKLQESGLDRSDLLALGMRAVPSARDVSESYKPLPALYIPYLDPLRPGQPMVPWAGWPAFHRVRYLGQTSTFGESTAKLPRYAQEPGAGVCAYFPTLTTVDWPAVLADPTRPLLITEGELKAAKACKEGFPTIGLGGVYSYRSAALGLTFLEELAAIDWRRRDVYVVYDSDFRRNEQVCKALNDLSEELRLRGAFPHVVSLPDVVDGGKTGLDDFLVARSADALSELLKDRAQPLTLARDLWNLNEEVVYVQDPGLIVVRRTGQRLSPGAFKEHAYSARPAAEQVLRPDGGVSLKQVSAAEAWLRWPLRAEVTKMTYAPGKPRVSDDAWNVWPGWGVEPAKAAGDVSPFLELIDHVFDGAEPRAREWFLAWCACPLQRPGLKMFSAAVVHGIKHGTGKSLVGYTLGRIYGRNFTEIRQGDLTASFNEWAENKQLVLADDITGSGKRQDADLLKKLITQRELRVNAKYVPSYVVPDCVNYYFTSNQPDAFFLEDDDRRFFVHEVTGPPLPREFYAEYLEWLDSGGSSLIFRWLLDLDLGDFDPAAEALRTRAKELMTEDVRSDLGAWVRRLKTDPDHALVVGQAPVPGDLFTSRQLLQVYDPEGRTGTTANGLARELRRAGVELIRRGIPVASSEGQARYYAVRNVARWRECSAADAAEHVESLVKRGRGRF